MQYDNCVVFVDNGVIVVFVVQYLSDEIGIVCEDIIVGVLYCIVDVIVCIVVGVFFDKDLIQQFVVIEVDSYQFIFKVKICVCVECLK